MWKTINNIAATRPTSHSKINGLLDVNGNLVNESKEIGNAMNKNFESIADNFIKKRMDFVCDLSEFSLNSGKSQFVFKAISKTEIAHYIKYMNPNKNVLSDVPSIRFVKLKAKIISPYLT